MSDSYGNCAEDYLTVCSTEWKKVGCEAIFLAYELMSGICGFCG